MREYTAAQDQSVVKYSLFTSLFSLDLYFEQRQNTQLTKDKLNMTDSSVTCHFFLKIV